MISCGEIASPLGLRCSPSQSAKARSSDGLGGRATAKETLRSSRGASSTAARMPCMRVGRPKHRRLWRRVSRRWPAGAKLRRA
jgi:hypothetical protein